MPITRRRRANPPDQPEDNNNNHLGDQTEKAAEAANTEEKHVEPSAEPDSATVLPPNMHPIEPEATAQPDNNTYHTTAQPSLPPPPTQPSATANGDRVVKQDYGPIEGGRRTARGELFRRPPQPPPVQMMPPTPQAALQPPSHEIRLPLGEMPGDASGDPLHLAYNPGYTGADEVRSALLHKLSSETKHGGRARCWSCGSLAIAYECWNTRNKTFGEIGIAFCEICGVWSVM